MWWSRLLILAFVVLVNSAWIRGSASLTCPANDGSASAPSASIQHPTLLNGYSITIKSRLGCNVAGVNYAVGYATATSLSDPAGGGLPSGVTYSSNGGPGGSAQITITGSSPVTLNAWDFTLHNCVFINYEGTGGLTITNSHIGQPAGLTAGEIQLETGSSGGLVLNNNIIDGGACYTTGSNGDGIDYIYNISAGNVTIEYNWIKNLSGNPLAQINSGAITIKYNLFEHTATYPGSHMNYQQFSSTTTPTFSSVVQFNTVVAYAGDNGGEGFQFYDNDGTANGSVLSSADFGYNTLLALKSNSYAVNRANSTSYSTGTIFLGSTVPGGAISFGYEVCAGSSWSSVGSDCVNGNGATCTTASSVPAAYAADADQVIFSDGTCFVAGGTVIISSWLHGSNDTGNFKTKLSPGPGTVHDNYFDVTAAGLGSANNNTNCSPTPTAVFYAGVWGAGNGPSGTVAWTAPSANYNMVTGAAVCGTYP